MPLVQLQNPLNSIYLNKFFSRAKRTIMSSKFLYLIAFVYCLSVPLFAQKPASRFIRHEKLSVTAGLGFSTYYGDLCSKFECMKFRPNFGIGAWYRVLPNFSVKAELNYFRLYAKDVYPKRNLDFRSGNVELYTALVYDVFNYTKHYRKRRFLSPYFFAGIGLTYFDPHGQDPATGSWVALRPLKTEGASYSPFTMILPYGAGVRIKYLHNLEILVEAGYRKTFTDRLDDVSSAKYPDASSFNGNDQAARMSLKAPEGSSYYNTSYRQLRGNSSKKDGYFIFNIKVRYVIGTKNIHFKGKHPLLKPIHH